MYNIKYTREIGKSNPIMVAGWPGMGNVALSIVDYLHRKLRAVKFAEIEVDPLAVIDSVTVDDGVATLGPIPKNIFYYSKEYNLIIFKGEAQLPGQDGIMLLDDVLDVAVKVGVTGIYTSAAFPIPVSHKESSILYSAVNKSIMRESFAKFGILPMESGHIAGLNGLLLGFAEKRKINAACVLATIPQYAVNLPNPRATYALLDALQQILSLKLDLAEVSEHIKEMDEKMIIVEEKVSEAMTIDSKDREHHNIPEIKITPPYIIEKIERLFIEATMDKSKAAALKNELDRWDLYGMYEDRFLDLFKK